MILGPFGHIPPMVLFRSLHAKAEAGSECLTLTPKPQTLLHSKHWSQKAVDSNQNPPNKLENLYPPDFEPRNSKS